MKMPDEKDLICAAVPEIIQWYSHSRRALPWRTEPTPYHVWISEIMLQQTRIEAVLGYYARFLEALPTVEALAAVEEDRLLKLWEGLGYYSRARNLKKAAVQLVEQYGGRLPETAEELRRLPGIGDYTAGAIASIAYGQPAPAVDGNVLRVMSRLLASDEDIMAPATRKRIAGLLQARYPSGEQAALLTEGIMELGETLCIPNGAARCELCPLRHICRACLENSVDRFPVKAAAKARRIERRTVLLLRCRGQFAMRRRENKGLLAGLWEFPGAAGWIAEKELPELLRREGIEITGCRECGEAKHVFTHVEWHMRGYLVECAEQTERYRWVSPQEIRKHYSIPTALRYYQRQMEAAENGA